MKKAYWSYKIGEKQLPSEFYEPPQPYKTGYDLSLIHI